jgi:uncharacterized delta-60 repeat protein
MKGRVGAKTVIASAGVCCAALGAGTALAAAGDFDPTFDDDGTARSDFDGSEVADLAIQGDGKIVAVGTGETEDPTGDETAAIGRYTTTGAPDPAFLGGAGVSGAGQYNSEPTRLSSVAVRPTGPIVTAGHKEPGGSPVAVVAQHLGTGPTAGVLNSGSFAPPDGILDVNFAAGEPSTFLDLELVPSTGDAIAVGATLPAGGVPRLGIASVTSAGALESGFGQSGSGLRTVSPSTIVSGNTGGDDAAFAVAVDPVDSSIVVAGFSDPTDADGGANDDGDASVVFLSASGTVTNTELIDIDDRDVATDVALQPDGKVLLAGNLEDNPSGDDDLFVARLETDGDLDPTFGGDDGIVQGGVEGVDDGDWSLVLLPDGRIVLAGATPGFPRSWLVARYTAAGVPDTSFDGDGNRVYEFGDDREFLQAAALQTDGKLVVGGAIGDDWAVGRLLLADDPPPAVNSPAVTPIAATPAPTPRKKCKKGRKLKKGKCVKKKRKKRR